MEINWPFSADATFQTLGTIIGAFLGAFLAGKYALRVSIKDNERRQQIEIIKRDEYLIIFHQNAYVIIKEILHYFELIIILIETSHFKSVKTVEIANNIDKKLNELRQLIRDKEIDHSIHFQYVAFLEVSKYLLVLIEGKSQNLSKADEKELIDEFKKLSAVSQTLNDLVNKIRKELPSKI